jgi:hypothetical protein
MSDSVKQDLAEFLRRAGPASLGMVEPHEEMARNLLEQMALVCDTGKINDLRQADESVFIYLAHFACVGLARTLLEIENKRAILN